MSRDVLIVDDEMDFRLTLAEMFVDLGYRVNTAQSANQAMNYLMANTNHLPDLITLDINMPFEDGMTFQKKLRLLRPDIPLIMISGLSGLEEEKFFGVEALLHKPLDKFELKAVLDYFQL